MDCGYSWDEFKYLMRIDKRLLPVKLFYFFFFAGVSILLPYIPLYQKQLGLTKIEAGFINALMPFLGSFARPLFAVIADKINRHRIVLLVTCLMSGLLHLLLIFVPYAPTVPSAYRKVDVLCSETGSHICHREMLGIFRVCDESKEMVATNCFVNCSFPKSSEACFRTTPTGMCVDHVTNSTSLAFQVDIVKQEETAGGSSDGPATFLGGIHGSEHPIINGSDKYAMHQPTQTNNDKCSEYQLNDITFSNSNYSKMSCKNQTEPLSCKFHCDTMKCKENPDTYIHHFSTTFWTFAGIYMIAQIFYAPCSSLNDAIAYELLADKRHRWGRQRVWGTIGFGLMAGLSGPILDSVLRADGSTNYGISCYLFIGFMILAAMSAYALRVPENFHCSKMMKNIGTLLREPPVVAFMICLFLFGVFFGAIVSFLFWYLLDLEEAEYHNNHKIVCGLSLLMNALTEIPILFFSGKIIKKVGEVGCLYIAFTAYGIRFLSYAFLFNIWMVLPVELLHGLTFGLMFPAATMYASQIAPPGMSATLQGVVSGLHFGFGWGIGSLVASLLYASIGGSYMFLTFSIMSFVSGIVYAVLNNCVFKSSRVPDAVYTINDGQPAATQLGDDKREYYDDDADESRGAYRDDGEATVQPPPADTGEGEDAPSPEEPLFGVTVR